MVGGCWHIQSQQNKWSKRQSSCTITSGTIESKVLRCCRWTRLAFAFLSVTSKSQIPFLFFACLCIHHLAVYINLENLRDNHPETYHYDNQHTRHTLSTPYSDSGRDFVLTYQIKPVQEQPLQSQVLQQPSQAQQTGQFSQPSNTIVGDHRITSPRS